MSDITDDKSEAVSSVQSFDSRVLSDRSPTLLLSFLSLVFLFAQMLSKDKNFHLRCFTESHPAHFVRGRLAGLENLPAEQRRETEALI